MHQGSRSRRGKLRRRDPSADRHRHRRLAPLKADCARSRPSRIPSFRRQQRRPSGWGLERGHPPRRRGRRRTRPVCGGAPVGQGAGGASGSPGGKVVTSTTRPTTRYRCLRHRERTGGRASPRRPPALGRVTAEARCAFGRARTTHTADRDRRRTPHADRRARAPLRGSVRPDGGVVSPDGRTLHAYGGRGKNGHAIAPMARRRRSRSTIANVGNGPGVSASESRATGCTPPNAPRESRSSTRHRHG